MDALKNVCKGQNAGLFLGGGQYGKMKICTAAAAHLLKTFPCGNVSCRMASRKLEVSSATLPLSEGTTGLSDVASLSGPPCTLQILKHVQSGPKVGAPDRRSDCSHHFLQSWPFSAWI